MKYFIDEILDFFVFLFVFIILVFMVVSSFNNFFDRGGKDNPSKIGIIKMNGGANDARDSGG